MTRNFALGLSITALDRRVESKKRAEEQKGWNKMQCVCVGGYSMRTRTGGRKKAVEVGNPITAFSGEFVQLAMHVLFRSNFLGV